MTTNSIQRYTMETKIKKIVLSFLTLTLFVCCVSCSNARTNFYTKPTNLVTFEDTEYTSDILDYVTDPSEEQMDICNDIIQEISRVYETSKDVPEIRCLPDEYFKTTSPIDSPPARYDSRLNVLFISTKFNMTGASCFCREYINYIADNGDDGISGIMHVLDDGNNAYLVGKALNIGIVNYFSNKVCVHPQNSYAYQYDYEYQYQYVYEYETHIANELAIIFGEDKLWQSFTTGDWESLYNSFNQKVENYYPTEKVENIEVTPFDVLQCILDNHQNVMASFTSDESGLDMAMKDFASNINCIEEMLFNYSSQSGCVEKSVNEVKDFLDNSSGYFSYKSLTYIREIWGMKAF